MPFLKPSMISPTLTAAFVLGSIAPCAAQELPPVPAAPVSVSQAPPQGGAGFPRPLLTLLRAAPYDPAERGPLLVVVPTPFLPPTAAPSALDESRRVSLPAIAAAADMHLVLAGQINVLAGRTMMVLNTNPGRANPFGSLSAGECLKLLLASFTPAQWQQAGSAAGFGKANLTDDQLPLWAQILPEQSQIQKSTLQAGDAPNSWQYVDASETVVHPRDTGRIRLSKTVDFLFYKTGTTEVTWGSNPYWGVMRKGATEYTFLRGQPAPGTLPGSAAYGVPLLTQVPRKLKTGEVDFAAPVLDKRISLINFPPDSDVSAKGAAPAASPPVSTAEQQIEQQEAQAQADLAALPTVGDLLARITKTTKIEFVADERIRDLPVFLRGDSARSGDVLMALCQSVAGAFRKMEPGDGSDTAPLYLLTDDVSGIGSRAALLGEWGEAAEALKRRMSDKADAATAKNDPLAFLSFAPGDAFALSKTQTEKLESKWRNEKFGTAPDVLSADMSPALREAVQQFADERAKEGVGVRTDRVRVGETLRAFLILPEMKGAVVPADHLSGEIGGQYLQQVAFDPTKKPPVKPASPPTKPPAKDPPLGFEAASLKRQRRILIVRPKNAEEAVRIVQAAAGRGITDVWLEVRLSEPSAATRLLHAAIAAAGKKVAVGGMVYLLKGGENNGEPDRNILGETGQAFRDRRVAAYASEKHFDDSYKPDLDPFTGWIVFRAADAALLRQQLAEIAGIPGLAGLTLRSTGGPGWTGQKQGGDGLHLNSAQGYTAPMRRAFLRERGIDPVDIPDLSWQLREIQWNLGFFQADDGQGEWEVVNDKMVLRSGDVVPHTAWWNFRLRKNTEMLAGLWKAVKKARPLLPLYLDDRVSGYTHANTDWFGSWDTPEGVPNTDPYTGESETRATARRTSKTIFAHWGWWWGNDAAAKANAPALFARQVSASALRNPPPAWDGLVIDLSQMPGASAVGLLEGLPPVPVRP